MEFDDFLVTVHATVNVTNTGDSWKLTPSFQSIDIPTSVMSRIDVIEKPMTQHFNFEKFYHDHYLAYSELSFSDGNEVMSGYEDGCGNKIGEWVFRVSGQTPFMTAHYINNEINGQVELLWDNKPVAKGTAYKNIPTSDWVFYSPVDDQFISFTEDELRSGRVLNGFTFDYVKKHNNGNYSKMKVLLQVQHVSQDEDLQFVNKTHDGYGDTTPVFISWAQSGPSYLYSSNDVLLEKRELRNGSRHGMATGYFKDGNERYIRVYEDGELVRIVFRKSSNGEIEIKDGNGAYKSYYENGNLSFEAPMLNGVRNGIAIWYHQNGKKSHAIRYKPDGKSLIGKRMEILYCYDQDGNELNKGTLHNGNGTIITYNEYGMLSKETIYENGYPKN